MAADHQLRWKRPGLAGDIGYVAHLHPDFLEAFARHGFLDRFARFDKAGQGRIHPRRKARLAPHQQVSLVLDQHDRDRIGARKVLGFASVAIALPPALGDPGCTAAAGAKAVPGVPANQAARAAIKRQFSRIERCHGRPNRRAGIGRARRPLIRHRSKAGLAIQQPQEHQFRVRIGIGQGAPFERTGISIDRRQPIQLQQARAPVHHARQGIRIGANVIGSVDRRTGEGNRCLHAPRIAARSVCTVTGNSAWIGRASDGMYWV